jgi:ABC-2 type transport system ATP-binding protein
VGLLVRQNTKFKEYSLGMKQRLAIGSCLLGDPDVLVLDEPTNGLDPEGINQVRELIKGIAEDGKTIILASHLLDEVEKVCDHVAILKSGIMMRCGSVNEILTDDVTFEIGCTDVTKLKAVIEGQKDLKLVAGKNNRYIIQSKDESFNAEKLNALLYSNGVVLNHLTEKKKSLEDQFLQIVKGQ